MTEKKKPSKISHDGHRRRVWQDFTRFGIDDNTPPHKVLELILYFTIPRKDTNELAHIILDRFQNSLPNVMDASVEQLMAASITDNKDIPRISEYTASHIKLILEIAKYYQTAKARQERRVFDRETGSAFLVEKLANANVETAYLLCLDNVNRFLDCPKIATGDEVAVALSYRNIVKLVTQIGATKVLLAHNHPRGLAFPSRADIKVTERIVQALEGISVELMDHIVVADNDYVSMFDSKEYEFLFEL